MVDFQKIVKDVSSIVSNLEILVSKNYFFLLSGWFWYDAGKSDWANSSRIEKAILSRKSSSYDAAVPRCLILAVWRLRPGYGSPKIHNAQSNWAPTEHDLQVRKSLYELYLYFFLFNQKFLITFKIYTDFQERPTRAFPESSCKGWNARPLDLNSHRFLIED